jgi:hypothetical protein
MGIKRPASQTITQLNKRIRNLERIAEALQNKAVGKAGGTADRKATSPLVAQDEFALSHSTSEIQQPEVSAQLQMSNSGEMQLYDTSKDERIDVVLPSTGKVYKTPAAIAVPSSYFLDLRTAYYSPYKLSITADWLTLHDNDWNTIGISSVNELNDISVYGVGGRDQSATFTPNTWVYFYIIYNSATNDISSLSSASTSPTLPSGYNYFVKVSSTHLIGYINPQIMPTHSQRGKKIYTLVAPKWEQGPTSADYWETVSLIDSIPPTAISVFGIFGNSSTLGSQQTIHIASTTGAYNEYCFTMSTRTAPGESYSFAHALFFDIPIINSQQMAWRVSSTASHFAILIEGYEDDL